MLETLSLLNNLHVTRANPVSLVHFVTNWCNARCSFCFIDFDNPKIYEGLLSVEEIDRFTKTLGPHLRNVNLTGGEPFGRKEIVDIARCYFRNTRIESIFITSNGSMPERMEQFARTLNAEFPGRKIIFSLSIDAFPDEHNQIRKVRDLFGKCLDAYRRLKLLGGDTMVNIGITVSHENHAIVPRLYESLIEQHGVKAITAIIVRDEGVYRTPREHKEAIVGAYDKLTQMIARDLNSGRLDGYDKTTLKGRLMNGKNQILYQVIKDTYVEPRFVSPCHAGGLFGVLGADGTVYPCELLKDRALGNIRDYDYDFLRLWHDSPAQEAKQWIKQSECHCSYECAWTLNILGNARYQPRLLVAALAAR